MVNCNEFRRLASEFLDGEERPELAEHLSACAACQALAEDLKAISTAAASLPALEPRNDLWLSLRQRAEDEGLIPAGKTMDCREFEKYASDVLDGAERPELAEHLSACAACQALAEDLKAISMAAASLPALEPQTDLWLSLRRRVEDEGLISASKTMDCREFDKYAGGVLEGERNPEAFDHVYGCARCRDFLHELDAVARAAHDLPSYEPSPLLWKRLRETARKEHLWQEDSWWERWLVPQPVLASSLATAALVLGLVLVSVDSAGPVRNAPGRSSLDVARSEMVSDADYSSRYNVHLLHVERAVLDEEAGVDDLLVDLTQKPLGTVDRAIDNTRRALSENPGDELMQDELNRLYRQKATVLAAMTDLTWQEYGE